MKSFPLTRTWLLIVMATWSIGADVMPNASKSEYFETKGAMFLLDRTNMTFRYWLLLSVSKPFPKDAIVEAVFENPTNKNSPLTTTRKLDGTEKELRLESSSVHGLKYRKNYDSDVRLFADGAKKNLVSTHKQQVQHAMPPKELKRITNAWKKN